MDGTRGYHLIISNIEDVIRYAADGEDNVRLVQSGDGMGVGMF